MMLVLMQLSRFFKYILYYSGVYFKVDGESGGDGAAYLLQRLAC